MSDKLTLDELIELASIPVDIVAMHAGVPSHEMTDAVVRATLTYLLDIGAIEAQPRDRLPELLPMRVGNPIAFEHEDEDADAGVVIRLMVDGSKPVAVTVHHGDLVTIITSNDGWQPQIAAVEINRAGSMDPEQAWIEAMRAMARRAEGTP